MRSVASFHLLLIAALLLAGCSEPTPERSQAQVGAHDISFDAPLGWQRHDQEDGLFFKKEIAQIYVNDAGPVTVAKFKREIERAREVFRNGSLEQANDILNALNLRSYFTSIERWESFSDSLSEARALGSGRTYHDPDAIERAYTELLVQVASLPDRDITSLAIEALANYEPLDRRSIQSQSALVVDGQRAMLINTWDKLNHVQPMRYVFVINDGSFLVIRTGLGLFADIEPAFEALVASLRFQEGTTAK